MALKIGKQRFDDTLETDGVWANIAEAASGLIHWFDDEERPVPDDVPVGRVRVARFQNPDYQRMQSKLLGRYRRSIDADGMLPPELQESVSIQLAAHTLLKDWEGMDFGGESPEYTPDLGIEAFKADAEFRDEIVAISRRSARYRADDAEEDAETLGKS